MPVKRGIERKLLMFVFTLPQPTKSDLKGWKDHFIRKGIYCIEQEGKEGWVLLVEGKEADNGGHAYPEPKVTSCQYCGKPPPHAFGYFKYCDWMCMEADRRRKI